MGKTRRSLSTFAALIPLLAACSNEVETSDQREALNESGVETVQLNVTNAVTGRVDNFRVNNGATYHFKDTFAPAYGLFFPPPGTPGAANTFDCMTIPYGVNGTKRHECQFEQLLRSYNTRLGGGTLPDGTETRFGHWANDGSGTGWPYAYVPFPMNKNVIPHAPTATAINRYDNLRNPWEWSDPIWLNMGGDRATPTAEDPGGFRYVDAQFRCAGHNTQDKLVTGNPDKCRTVYNSYATHILIFFDPAGCSTCVNYWGAGNCTSNLSMSSSNSTCYAP